MIALLLGCSVGNTPPRFLDLNDLEVRHIFGINVVFTPLQTRLGERLDIEVGVRDNQRDRFELIWPAAPPGFDFDSAGTTGSWTVPEDYWRRDTELSVIARDEHGASDVLYLVLSVTDIEPEDTGGVVEDVSYLFGEVDPDTFQGSVGIYSLREGAECLFTWPEIELLGSPDDCAPCARAWEIAGSGGLTVQGDCGGEPWATAELEPLGLGWVEDGTMMMRVDGLWQLAGQGTLEETLSFGVVLP